ncbi:MAG: holo-ACP synthase [Oleiphilaceae bacterium]|nr:holo-ACP synthase [Oleiphilaceae bacterium]
MLVKGVGTDLVEVARIKRSIEERGDSMAERILSEREMEAYRDASKPADFLAKRFAVKEAVSKALGTGFSHGVTWKDIELDHHDTGQPFAILHGRAQERLQELGGEGIYVSLSDEAGLVSAFAVMG